MIKYLGSKRRLIDNIVDEVNAHHRGGVVVDLFSGTSRVGYALKASGKFVIANDHNDYAHTIATCYVQASRGFQRVAENLISELNGVKGKPGFITYNYCEEARFFQPFNGEKIDAIRSEIDRLDLDPTLRAIALTSLVEAADRVDSTVGLQMAYLKQWSKRSYNELQLRVPELLDGHGLATKFEADELVGSFGDIDVLYMDPPYNQHSYLSNYHIWETIIRGDEPEVYGVARKRIDCRERKSGFNSKRKCLDSLRKVVENNTWRTCILSYSNEGHLTFEDLIGVLGPLGEVSVKEIDLKRHICSKIGVYSPEGILVGERGKTTNTEYLITCKSNVSE